METKTVRLVMVGFGNAAQAFCKMLMEKESWLMERFGVKVLVTGISARSKGAALNPGGIDLANAISEVETYKKLQKDAVNLSVTEMIESAKADCLVELSTLSIKDGQPAISYIEQAINRGLHIITANKGPVAWKYHQLKALADEKSVVFLNESTVMDGAPIFNLVRETLRGCKILSFSGILNATTNYVLEAMEKGLSREDAIKDAQRRGFAEADPSLDINGYDAAAKTSALANVCMNARLTPDMVDITGIGGITAEDIKKAKEKGQIIKLVCEGFYENGEIKGKVSPARLPLSHTFASVKGVASVVSFDTDLMGTITIVEHEHNNEIQQTAYGIFSDLTALIIQRY